MTTLLERMDRALEMVFDRPWPWWLWPAILVATGVLTWVASLGLHPGHDEFVYFPNGMRFGDTCGAIVLTGLPCPQCGMTRSWVHAARFDLSTAFFYSPGGLGLFLWAQVGAAIGLVRLVTRNPRALTPPFAVSAAWTGFWLIGLYGLPWILRLAGINPLP
ncbi:MAG: DUF2752 domain-containing protein [Myxococcota bacterium]